MTPRAGAAADGDWWVAHLLVAVFVLLVAAILRAVPGWSAPLHAWIAVAAFAIGAAAVHAAARAAASAWRLRWRAALVGVLLAAGLGAAASGLLLSGHAGLAKGDEPFPEAPARVGEAAR